MLGTPRQAIDFALLHIPEEEIAWFLKDWKKKDEKQMILLWPDFADYLRGTADE